MVNEFLSTCEVCAKYNVRKRIATPIGHIPVPEGPFMVMWICGYDKASTRQKVHACDHRQI